MELNHSDTKQVIKAVNQGIDSRLEGFTQSIFRWDNTTGKLECLIANYHELQILIRRLVELQNEQADQLSDDIVSCVYNDNQPINERI